MSRRTTAFLALLFMAGAAHWVLFFCLDHGLRLPTYRAGDWPKEYRYASVLKQAVTNLEVPYYISRPIPFTRKFLALPEVTWSPQALLLLRFLSVPVFFVVNTVLLYAAGFVGLLLIRRRFGLSLLPFALMFLVFDFNGHVTAHLAAGHSMWAGYFLLPFFALLVLELADDSARPRSSLLLGLALFAILLQGAYHIFVWCVLLVLLMIAFRPRLARPLLVALAWAALLSLWRLAPAAFLVGHTESGFLRGFAGVTDLARSLVVNVAEESKRYGLDWWEYDTFIGLPACLFLAWFGVRPGRFSPAVLYGPLAVLSLLSLGTFYRRLNLIPVPLLSEERVATRFLILPIVFLTVTASAGLQKALSGPRRRAWTATAGAAVAATAILLGAHSFAARLTVVEEALPARGRELGIAIVPPERVDDARHAAYLATVRVSAAVSGLALLGAAVALRRAGCVSRGRSPSARPSREG